MRCLLAVRLICAVAVICAVAARIAAQPAPRDAAAILAAARDALGGDKRIAALKTLVATGRTRQVRGDNLVSIEFEIDVELPDKYVRTDEIPAQESGPTRRGFNGATLILSPAPAGRGAPPGPRGAPPPPAVGVRGGAPPPPGAGRDGSPPGAPGAERGRGSAPIDPLVAAKQDFARLALGWFASSFDAYPLAFTYAGTAEAPEGKADVLGVTAAGNFSARFFVGSDAHLPLMLTWGGPPAAPGLENRIYFADYRDVGGLRLPFRIRRAVGATTSEETTIDRYRINTKIDPKKFEVRE